MAAKTLESRFEHLSVNDENDAPASTILKSKVSLVLVSSAVLTALNISAIGCKPRNNSKSTL